MIDHTHYTYRVSWSAEDKEFIARCAEFPSLSFLSDTNAEALQGLVDLVGQVVQDMRDTGEEIPQPFSDRHYSGTFQLRIPPDLHRSLAIEASEQGVSLNRHISAKL